MKVGRRERLKFNPQTQIDSILRKASVISLQKECNQAFNEKRELSKSGKISDYIDERTRLYDHLKDLQQRKNILVARDTSFEKELKEAHKRVEEQKKGLEKILSELSNKKFKILID